jgi:hypothetical protein
MFLHVYEAETLILFAVYAKGTSTDADFDANVLQFERLAAQARSGETASIVVIAQETNPPGARYRQRLADIEDSIPKVNVSVVSQEKASFLVMKVFNWLAPERPGLARSIHPTYERARNWHVQKGVHPAAVFDALYEDVRRRMPSFDRASGVLEGTPHALSLARRAQETTSRAPR